MALDQTYLDMTIDQLQSAFVDLGLQLAKISDTRQEMSQLIAQRIAAANAQNHVADLTVEQKDALRKALEARDSV